MKAYLDSRYTPSDVRHSFRTESGQTIDCIDFFAQQSVREDAKRGIVLTEMPTPPPVPTEFPTSPMAYVSDPGTDADGHRRVCPSGSVPTPRITAAHIAAQGGLDAYVGSLRRPKHPPAPPPRPLDAPPPSPPPSNGGACTQFPQGDLSSPSEGAFAHVQQTVYPGSSGSANIVKGGGTFSIYAPGLDGTDSHSLMQIWMYSGWGFDGFGCTCGGTTGIPCIESVEVGWDVDPANMGGETGPVFFTFSTWGGYSAGSDCYNGAGCDEWHGFGGTLFPLYQLPSSLPGSAPQYELPIVVVAGGSGSSAGWWIYAGVTALYGSGGIAPGWIGYYPFTQFTGLMASGQAQEFQIGAEVDDFPKGADAGAPWHQVMGSGQAPSTGYGNAAYVYTEGACSSVACYSPTAVGPVTVPDAYGYSTATAAGASYWTNYFYVGDVSERQYSWAKFTIGPSTPTLFAPPREVGGYATLTLAPTCVSNSTIDEAEFRIYAVTDVQDTGDTGWRADEFSSLSAGLGSSWAGLNDNNSNPLYVVGVSVDQNNGGFWGWDSGGNVYTNDGYSAITLERSAYSSVSAWSSASVYAVSTGGAIYYGTNTGTWTYTGMTGYSQVAFDTIAWQYDSNPWILDTSGIVYVPPSYGVLTNHICGDGGTMNPLTQIAVKNEVVFGLGDKGTVWYYTLANGCWKQVGGKFEFANSIATDNGSTTAVWASDGSGNIWTAE